MQYLKLMILQKIKFYIFRTVLFLYLPTFIGSTDIVRG